MKKNDRIQLIFSVEVMVIENMDCFEKNNNHSIHLLPERRKEDIAIGI
jgi:hypothetical protein